MRPRFVAVALLAGLMCPSSLLATYRCYLAQVANGTYPGGYMKTRFLLLNSGAGEISLTLTLTGDDGTPLAVGLQGLGSASRFEVSLGSGASRILETDGSGVLVAGAAVVSCESTFGASAVFALYDAAGTFLTEAAVGSSSLVSSFVIPVDCSTGFNTGLAIHNPNVEEVSVSMALYDTGGVERAGSVEGLRIPGRGHLARFVAGELFPAVAAFRGSLVVSAAQPLAAVTLRQKTAPLRYTTLPVVPKQTARRDFLLPQIANGRYNGGSMRTGFVLVNPSADAAAVVQFSLTGDEGLPLPLALAGRPAAAVFSVDLPPQGAAFLETDGSGQLVVGAARVASNSPIGVSATFTDLDAGGQFRTEAAVGSSSEMLLLTLPVETASDADTGIALQNPGAAAVSVLLRLLDQNGATAQSVPAPLQIPPGGHVARFVSEWFPGIGDFRGALAVSASSPVAAVTLRQKTSPMCYTTLPVTEGVAGFATVEAKTLGPEGGTIGDDLFSLTAPQGALATSADLKVSVSDLSNPFSPAPSTAAFMVEGLPSDFSKAVSLRLKFDAAASDSYFVAYGVESFVSSAGGLRTGFSFLPTTRSPDGYLTAELQPFETQPDAVKPPGERSIDAQLVKFGLRFIIVGLGGYRAFDGTHFRVYYSTKHGVTDDQARRFAGELENAYVDLERWGFSYQARSKWPVHVLARPMDVEGQYTNSLGGVNHGYIEIDSGAMGNDLNRRVTASHEFFHLVQSLYDPRGAVAKAYSKPEHHWLNEAVATWSETHFSWDNTYVPPNFVGNEGAVCRGLQGGNDNNDHGYGLAPVIAKFQQSGSVGGKTPIVRAYELLRSGVHPVEALVQCAPDLRWWFNFVEEYLLPYGGVYRVPSMRLAELNEDFFFVNCTERTNHNFPDSLTDMSVHFYLVRMDFDIRWPWKMRWRVTGPNVGDLRVYSVWTPRKGSRTIGYLYGQTPVNNVWKYDNNYSAPYNVHYLLKQEDLLLAVVSSRRQAPYTDKSVLDLEVEFIFPTGMKGGASANVSALRRCNDGQEWTATESLSVASPDPKDTAALSFGPELFSASWDYLDVFSIRREGSLNLEFFPAEYCVSFSGRAKSTSQEGYIREESLSLVKVPYFENPPLRSLFEARAGFKRFGEGVGVYIGAASYKTDQPAVNKRLICEMVSYRIVADSYVSVWVTPVWPPE